jgi:hypothetical protein
MSLKDEINELKKLNDELQNSLKELSFSQWQNARSALEKYNQELKKQKDILKNNYDATLASNIKALEEEVKRYNTQLLLSGQFWNKIGGQISDAKDEMHFFLVNTTAQYEYSEGIAKQYLTLNKRLGLTGEKAKVVRDNFKDALPDIRRMGGTAEELAESYEAFAEQSGRQNVLTAENLKNMAEFSLSTGLAVGEASRLYERFTLMGVSIDDANKELNKLVNDSNALGINSTKVLKVLQSNMDSMQRMSFKGGVRAMTEMAKLAVKMRMEISDMLGMADKFYEPEAAIEAAAQLQLMGGDIAAAFGDPFETMYLARNKPEELAKRLETMTENMVAFNHETGEYELPAEARQQLSFAAEQLGISKDNMIDLAIQSSKIKDIKMNVSGNITEDDMRETLAGMAQMKDGRWVVDVGESEPVDIADITQEQADKLKALSGDQEDIMKSQAMATMTNTEAIEKNTQALKDEIVRTVPIYETTAAALKQPLQEFNTGIGNLITTFKGSQTGKMVTQSPEKLGEFFGKGLSTTVNKGMANVNDGLKDVLNAIDPVAQTIGALDADSLNKIFNNYSKMVGNPGGGVTTNTTNNSNQVNNLSNQQTQQMMTTVMSKLQDINFDGKIDFSEIKLVIDDTSSTMTLSAEDKKEIIKMVQQQIKLGNNGIYNAGQTTGINANTGSGGN